MNNPNHPAIAIIGAGISGLSAALALSQKGFTRIELFERADRLEEVGAGIQLGPNAVRALRNLGVGEPLGKCADNSAWGYLREGESNRLLSRLPLSEYSEKQYALPSYQVLRSDLHSILLDQVTEAGVTVTTGKKVVRINSNDPGIAAELHFDTGGIRQADLVIGADGINSVLARQMYPDYPNYFSGVACWRTLIDNQDSDAARIHSMSVWVGEGKHLIAYPVANSTRVNLVGVVARQSWEFPEQVQGSTTEDWLRAYEGWAPDALRLIAKAQAPRFWGLFERPVLPAWSKANCVLIGDAAHPMLPSLAQGAAQGIEDAIVLAELLAEALEEAMTEPSSKFKTAPEQVLGQLYRRRHERVERVQASARWNLDYFHQPKGFYRLCRNLAMQLAGPIGTELIARRYHWLYRQ